MNGDNKTSLLKLTEKDIQLIKTIRYFFKFSIFHKIFFEQTLKKKQK